MGIGSQGTNCRQFDSPKMIEIQHRNLRIRAIIEQMKI
jgi:hypothetical protein